MSPIEFTAYAKGFVAGVNGLPTQEQWDEFKTTLEGAGSGEKQPAIPAPKRKGK